jgi:hypothetical protein
MYRWFGLTWLCAGCGSVDAVQKDSGASTSSSTTRPDSACGDVIGGLTVQLLGNVTLYGKPVEGASVTIEEHTWVPGTVHGTGQTEKSGVFDVWATELVSVEGCWGLMLDYTAEASFMGHSASRNLNSALLGALTTGGGVADIRPLPIELDEVTDQTDTGW